MPTKLLIALCLIPSMVIAYVVLTTFYGANKAFMAISWVPLSWVVIIWLIRLPLGFANFPDDWWRVLAMTIVWMSLVQATLGIGLVVRALVRSQWPTGLLLATLLTASPAFLHFIS